MARRKQVSPPDEFGNRFVTYTEITPEAVLAQPNLRTTKQSVQTQRIAKNNGGGDPSDDDFSFSDPTGYDNADNPNSPNSEGDNAAQSVQSLSAVANVASVASTAFGGLATPPGQALTAVSVAAQARSNQLDASRKSVSPAQNLQMKAEELLGIEKTGASRKAFKQMQIDNLAIDDKTTRDFINQEPEAGYRSTGNPKGSRSDVSDVGGALGSGPSTRGPAVDFTIADSSAPNSSASASGPSADPSEGSDNGIP